LQERTKLNNQLPVFTNEDRKLIDFAANRRLIYLDFNVWINIAEKLKHVAAECRRAVSLGKVLFPVSNATVSEVIEQLNSAQRARLATLMDDLCRGICFKPSDDIYKAEATSAFAVILGQPVIKVSRERTLTWIVECFGQMAISFPSSWSEASAKQFNRQLSNLPELRSVKWLADHLPVEEMRAKHDRSKKDYVERMRVTMEKCASEHQHLAKDIRRKKLLLEERDWALNKFVSPQITKNLLEIVGPEKTLSTIEAISREAGEGSEQRLEQVMAVMPSLDLYCRIMAERGINPNRKPKGQDFHDAEHAIVGSVYADAFVTADGYLFDLLTHRCSIPVERGCNVVRGVVGLEEVLKEL
jgi:hypothetical protein